MKVKTDPSTKSNNNIEIFLDINFPSLFLIYAKYSLLQRDSKQ
jgi:hypothetical protein